MLMTSIPHAYASAASEWANCVKNAFVDPYIVRYGDGRLGTHEEMKIIAPDPRFTIF
jgi:hypothetical protein